MLGRLVKQFVKRGARDHLGGARRVQETTDLHRLFVLTAFHRTEGDGPELVSQVLAIGKDLQFDELKAEVCGNLTEQAHRVCAAVRDALAAARAASPSSQSDAFTKGVLDRIGFACRVAPSGAGPGSGDGLFVRGEVNPGEIVAFYPGLVYDLENVRHIPGYPKVSDGNEYLIARYDGSVVDANPWGSGGDLVAVDSECLSLLARRNGVTFDASRDSNRGQNEHFGRWPGPPLSPRRLDEEESETSEKKLKQEKRAGVGGFLDHTLTPPLCSLLRTTATAEALNLTRNNPLALAHFANHPPVGYRPNVVVAGVDLVFDAGCDLRRFAPNVGVGSWRPPVTLAQATQRKTNAAKRGWFATRLHQMFGEEGEEEDVTGKRNAENDDERKTKKTVVVPALVLVASEALQDEEVFLNYRLSTHVKRPEWYYPVDEEEDKRRWASE